MRPSLYNNEFVINDLLRAAHPGGGTTVISVDSPSGGEGRVEDLIERQLITIDRMVRRQTVASKIAELSNTLDEMGEIKLSFKAAKLMKIAEDVTAGEVWKESLKIFEEVFKDILVGVEKVRSNDEVSSRDKGMRGMIPGIKIRTERAFKEASRMSPENLKELESEFEDLAEVFNTSFKRLKEIGTVRGENHWTGGATWSKTFRESEKALTNKIGKAFKELAVVQQNIGDNNLEAAMQVMHSRVDEEVPSFLKRNPARGPASSDSSAPIPSGSAPSSAEEAVEVSKFSKYVEGLQKNILNMGEGATGIYDEATHHALYDLLDNQAGQEDHSGEIARRIMQKLYDSDSMANTRQNISVIYDSLRGRHDPTKFKSGLKEA